MRLVENDMNGISSRRDNGYPLFRLTVAYFGLAAKLAPRYLTAYPVKIGYICLTAEQIVITAENNVAILRTDPAYIQGFGV